MFNEEKYISKLAQTQIPVRYQLYLREMRAIYVHYERDPFELLSAAYAAGFTRGQSSVRNALKREVQ